MNKLINSIKSGKNDKEVVKALTGFNYRKKTNSLHMSNNELFLENMKAYSYDWWVYVKEIDGLIVFNEHRYSPSTGKHQSRMRSLLSKLNASPAVFINTRQSIDNFTMEDVRKQLQKELIEAREALAKCKRKGTFKESNLIERIGELKFRLETLP